MKVLRRTESQPSSRWRDDCSRDGDLSGFNGRLDHRDSRRLIALRMTAGQLWQRLSGVVATLGKTLPRWINNTGAAASSHERQLQFGSYECARSDGRAVFKMCSRSVPKSN
ncbi:uncharacterized protein J3R85_006095 [Psidium guajava]|nr:uncharacterized protein J3R85_006095 [Psidium guajava]